MLNGSQKNRSLHKTKKHLPTSAVFYVLFEICLPIGSNIFNFFYQRVSGNNRALLSDRSTISRKPPCKTCVVKTLIKRRLYKRLARFIFRFNSIFDLTSNRKGAGGQDEQRKQIQTKRTRTKQKNVNNNTRFLSGSYSTAMRREMANLPGSLKPRGRRGRIRVREGVVKKCARVAGGSWSGGSSSDDRIVAGQTKG